MYVEGDVICHQDDIADGLYYIVEGSVAVSAKSSNGEKHLATLQKGSLLGEIALVSQSRRTATVTAVQRCHVLKMEKENFTRFLGIFPQLKESKVFSELIKRRTASSLRTIPIFASLMRKEIGPLQKFDESKLELLGAMLNYKEIKKGDTIFRAGDKGDALYIIASGCCSVSSCVNGDVKRSIELNKLRDGDWFGEMSLMGNVKRSATVRATADTLLLKLDKKHFQSFLSLVPGAEREFQNRLHGRTAKRLSKIPYFNLVNENKPWNKLDLLATLFSFEEFKIGEKIMTQGERGDKFYIIIDGKAKVTAVSPDGNPVNLSTLGENDCFGEIALLEDTTRSATVTCETQCTLLSITRENFSKFLKLEPKLLEHFRALMQQRSGNTPTTPKE
mmetsp:Transcript_18580/g.26138  ORF Transcript_18580/g.26138 Transcript_18580/m.26138 type:complete len:390 (-) Transcript_18580:352-1521(-)